MATLVFKLLSLCNVLVAILLHFIPEKLRLYLPRSWYSRKLQTTLVPSSRNIQRLDSLGIRRSFQMFDHDGDGRITKEELRDSLQDLGIFVSAPDLKRVIDDVDSDGDGCIDFNEFAQLYGSIVGGPRDDGGDEIDLVRDAFDVFDLNGDGFITVDELWSVMGSLGIEQRRDVDDFRTMISKVDCDGDGRVSFDEFKLMLKGGL